MLASELLPLIRAYWPIILIAGFAIRLLQNKFHNGLNKYPGHPLAGYTNWWRYFDVRGRKAQWTHVELHRKHGDVVRLGPNVLSFADPRAIKAIYGLNKGMTKVSFSVICTVLRPVLTQFDSPSSTQYKQLSRKAVRSTRSSARQTKGTTPSTGDA